MDLVPSIIAALKRDPLRAILVTLGVGVGVAIVTLTVNVGNGLLATSRTAFATPGLRMVVATAELDRERRLHERTDVLSLSDMEALRRLVPGVKAVAAMEGAVSASRGGLILRTIDVAGERFQTRSAAAVSGDYATVYGLELVAGSFLDSSDSGDGGTEVVISEGAARALFGSAAAAVGETIGARVRGESGSDGPPVLLRVSGVYRDLPYAVRDAYDVADLLVPLDPQPTALGAFVLLVEGADARRAADLLADAVRSLHGRDVPVIAWEGSRWSYGSPTDRLAAEVRPLVLFIDAFGVLSLMIASTGVLTAMMVSVVERSRASGLRRALGSTRAAVAGRFVAEALVLTAAGAVLGVVVAASFSAPVVEALRPVFPGEDGGIRLPAGLRADAVLLGVLSALAAGALFSLPPALAAALTEPVEGMRDA